MRALDGERLLLVAVDVVLVRAMSVRMAGIRLANFILEFSVELGDFLWNIEREYGNELIEDEKV